MNRSDKRHILNVLVGRKEEDLDLEKCFDLVPADIAIGPFGPAE